MIGLHPRTPSRAPGALLVLARVAALGALAATLAGTRPASAGAPEPGGLAPEGAGFDRYMERLDALDALEKGLDKRAILDRFGADALKQTFGQQSFDTLFGEAPPVGPAADDKTQERLTALEAQRAAEAEARRVAAIHRGVNCWKSSWMLAIDLQESSIERGYALANLTEQSRFDALASVWLDDDFRDGFDAARDWLTGLGSLATGVGGVLVATADGAGATQTGGWFVGLGALGVLVGQGLDALFGHDEADLVKQKLAVLDLTRNAFDALRARLDDFDAVRASFATTRAALDARRQRFPEGKPDFLPRQTGLTDAERAAMASLLEVVPSYRDAVGRYLDLVAAQRRTADRVVKSASGLALPKSFTDVIARLQSDLASPDFDRDTATLRGMHDRAIELVARCVPEEQASASALARPAALARGH